ncbi:Retrovirus-related Pol polyprotein from transposon [Dictyocoela muelleri]|nr:Retrovirus-related Pol polyprotein from transposon [Dictyocoela muelleri]
MKYLSSIDLNNGYYQINMAEDDVFRTGFKILKMRFVFKKMPFGLCNAPTTFQMAMNHMLKDIKNVKIYLDDILVFSTTPDEHLNLLDEVFRILSENNVSINFEKSEFFKNKVEYLGHKITPEGIRPNITKIENCYFKQPKTRKQLERFFRLINWYRPFIKDLSQMSSTLYDKLKTRSKIIKWERKDEIIREKIIGEIKKDQPYRIQILTRNSF